MTWIILFPIFPIFIFFYTEKYKSFPKFLMRVTVFKCNILIFYVDCYSIYVQYDLRLALVRLSFPEKRRAVPKERGNEANTH